MLLDQIMEGMKATPFSCDPNVEDSLLWALQKWFFLSKLSLFIGKRLKPFEPGHYIYVLGLENYCTPSDSILSLAVHAQ